MSGRKKLILGNWKMHFSLKQATAFAAKLAAKKVPEGVVVGVGPTSLALSAVAQELESSDIKLLAQNAYFKDEGAFTGEISMPMLRGLAEYVLVGHSERRHVFHESNEVMGLKVASAIRSNIKPVLCVGETLVERQHYHTNQVINDQLTLGLFHLTADEVESMVIAYEPVWAIGTGKFADPEEVRKAVAKIRADISSLYGSVAAAGATVLYGGSVTKENALAYLKLEGVDGLLMGGSSLSVVHFWPIVEMAGQLIEKKITIKKEVK